MRQISCQLFCHRRLCADLRRHRHRVVSVARSGTLIQFRYQFPVNRHPTENASAAAQRDQPPFANPGSDGSILPVSGASSGCLLTWLIMARRPLSSAPRPRPVAHAASKAAPKRGAPSGTSISEAERVAVVAAEVAQCQVVALRARLSRRDADPSNVAQDIARSVETRA